MEKHSQQILVLIGTVVAVFGISLLNGFVWDDTWFFVGKEVYAEFQLREIFLSLANGVEYLPLRDLTYAIDHQIWGLNPAGFHFTNLIIYLANVLVVFYLARQLFLNIVSQTEKDKGEAARCGLLTALLFAVHPVHSEAVNFITCRNVLVSGFFFFLSCYFYLRYLKGDGKRDKVFYAGALLCFLGALLSKATTIILPLFLLLFSLLNKKTKAKDLLFLVPFFSLSMFFYFFFKAVAIQSNIINSRLVETGNSFISKIATAAEIPFFYLAKLLLPINLSVAYGNPFGTTLMDPWVIASLVALVIVGLLAFVKRKEEPLLLFLLGLYLSALIPVLNFFSTHPVVADRYSYLASFPFVLFLASYLTKFGRLGYRWPIYASALLLVTWSGLSFASNLVWKDERSLWQQTVKTSPRDIDAYLSLVATFYNAGDYKTTFNLLADMERFKTDKDYYEFYRGLISANNGELTSAIASYEKVLEKNDDFMAALSQMGHAYKQLGDYEKAMYYLNKAVESRDMPFMNFRLSATEDRAAILDILKPQLNTLRQRVLEKPADLQSRAELAIRLYTVGLYDEAIENYLALEKISPPTWQLSYNIANIYKKQRKFNNACRYYEKSLSLNPGNVDALNNLGTSHKEMGDYKSAIDQYKKAIAVDDKFALAAYNLATTYQEMGDMQNALRQFKYTGEKFPELRFKADIAVKNMQKQ